MESENKKLLNSFNRFSILTLITYIIAVAVTLYFTINQHEQILASSVKMTCYAIYLTFMMFSLTNLKNYFEATRKDDFSMDILIYTIIGIPIYIFAFFFIRTKIQKNLSNLD